MCVILMGQDSPVTIMHGELIFYNLYLKDLGSTLLWQARCHQLRSRVYTPSWQEKILALGLGVMTKLSFNTILVDHDNDRTVVA